MLSATNTNGTDTGEEGTFTATAPVPTGPVATADVSVAISSAASGKVGSPLAFAVTVRNGGPGTATAGRLWLSSAFSTISGVSASQGTCGAGTAAGCELGTIPAGGSVVVTVQVTPTATGRFELTGTVGAAAPDPAPQNNSATRAVVAKR